MKAEIDNTTETKTKKAKWLFPVAIIGFVTLYLFMYSDLPSKASVILSPGAIHITNIIQSGRNFIKKKLGGYNATLIAQIKQMRADASSVGFKNYTNEKLSKNETINLWLKHYINGVPIKPTKVFPTCDEFIKRIRDPQSKYQLISMYDPGNCAEIPNTRTKVFETLNPGSEKRELLAGPPLYELNDLCMEVNASLGDPNWRLCYGMPEIYHYGRWVHQRYKYSENITDAKTELGTNCLNNQVSLFFFQPNLDHQGGPRKVLNNLLTGFRLIGKPYVSNARNLGLFDYLFSPDPHHGYFMYFMGETGAKKFYIGPTVIYTQFNAQRITAAVRNYSHVVGASKRAIISNQYFPRMPLKRKNSVIIPTGVDETIFAPSNVSRTNALIYVKSGCDKHALNKLKLLIKLKIIEVVYGGYTETDFEKALQTSKYGIVCDGAETQGIAMEEMMSMDVPLFVTNPTSVPYFNDEVGVIMSTKGSLDTEFHTFVNNVNKGVYKPRKWLIQNLGIVNSVINTMKVFCGLPNKWNPRMQGAI